MQKKADSNAKKKEEKYINIGKGMPKNFRPVAAESVFNEISNSVKTRFLTPLAIFLNATSSQIGFLSAASSLATIIAQIPGSMAVSRFSRKKIWAYSNLIARSFGMFLIAFLPFVGGDPAIILLIIAGFLISFFASFREPCHSGIMADIVPKEIRSIYFGKRDSIRSLVAIFIVLIAGILLNLFGFSVIFVLGGIAGALSVPFIMKIKVPENECGYSFRKLIRVRPSEMPVKFIVNRQFVYFTVYAAFIRFAIGVADPFFDIYMLKDVGLDYTAFTGAIVIGIVSIFFFQRYWGKASQRFGNRNIMMVSGLFMCLTPIFYSISTNIYHLFATKLYVGFALSGFDLMLFSFLLEIIPSKNRHKHIARFNVFKESGFFAGNIAGAFLVLIFYSTGNAFTSGLKVIFIISALLRFAAFPILILIKGSGAKSNPYKMRYVLWETSAAVPVRFSVKVFNSLVFAFFRLPVKIIWNIKKFIFCRVNKQSWYFG